jgi:mitochondrial intermediate peptidase
MKMWSKFRGIHPAFHIHRRLLLSSTVYYPRTNALEHRCHSTTRVIKSTSQWQQRSKNNNRTFHKDSQQSETSNGLFSISALRKPSDFLTLASEAMQTCNSLRQTLASQSDIPVTTIRQASEALYLLDSISKHVCNVIDAAELCRCVHFDSRWRESASSAFSVLSDYITQLNADTNLYQMLQNVTNSTVFHDLNEEQKRFAQILKDEFERDGIHLPDDKRENVRRLQNHITQLETLFQENITNHSKHFTADAPLVEEIIPRHLLEAYVPQSGEIPGKVTLSTDPIICNTLSRYSSNPQLRKEIHMETTTSCPENLVVLEALRKVRHESASALGFASYADRALHDKMAQSPATVAAFLSQLQENIRPTFVKEMEMIANVKRSVEATQCGTIEPWDVQFYTSLIKAQNGFDPSQLGCYFTLNNCIQGMILLVEKLFGITMKEVAMEEDEIWDAASPKQSAIRKFVFSYENEMMGTMYLDLHPRAGKYLHAAHFTVLCGCAKTVEAQDYQRPVIALVLNLTLQQGTNVLSHSEVETLFHEFGHALHSLLSRTTFQHVSGTRVAMDFVETPSHLLEHFIWDDQFLRCIAFDALCGEVIPDDTLRKLLESRQVFKSLDIQNQILYSKLDQVLFGPPIMGKNSIQIFEELHSTMGIPYAKGTHWHSRFGHLVSYGAGYYGYLYAQTFANDIWQTCFAADSLSRSSGRLLWQGLLKHGGAREPMQMLREILGRDPSPSARLGR